MSGNRVGAVIFDVGNTLWFQSRPPDMGEIVRLQAHAPRRQLDDGAREVRLVGVIAYEIRPLNPDQ